MKVFFDAYCLCKGEILNQMPVGLEIRARSLVQDVYCIGAKGGRKVNRHNCVHEVRFSVMKKHKNQDEAVMYALTHATQLQEAKGDCTFVFEGGEKKIFKDAVLEQVQVSVNGPLSQTDYGIIGSLIE